MVGKYLRYLVCSAGKQKKIYIYIKEVRAEVFYILLEKLFNSV